ncbi:hypothetical protein DPMN_028696, partial [Dreissena polymorpha]
MPGFLPISCRPFCYTALSYDKTRSANLNSELSFHALTYNLCQHKKILPDLRR